MLLLHLSYFHSPSFVPSYILPLFYLFTLFIKCHSNFFPSIYFLPPSHPSFLPSPCPPIQRRLAVSYRRTLLIGCQLWLVNNISPQRQEPRLLEWILDTNLRINLNGGDNNMELVSTDGRTHDCEGPSVTSSQPDREWGPKTHFLTDTQHSIIFRFILNATSLIPSVKKK